MANISVAALTLAHSSCRGVHHEDRWRSLQRQAAAQRMRVEELAGVCGTALEKDARAREVVMHAHRSRLGALRVPTNKLALTASTFWAFERAESSGTDWLLLLEDDALLPPRLLAVAQRVLQRLRNASVVWLDARAGPYHPSEPGFCCTSAMLYSRRARRILLSQRQAVFSLVHKTAACDLGITSAANAFLRGEAARVPIVGVVGFVSSLKPSRLARMDEWKGSVLMRGWDQARVTWPAWLRRELPGRNASGGAHRPDAPYRCCQRRRERSR